MAGGVGGRSVGDETAVGRHGLEQDRKPLGCRRSRKDEVLPGHERGALIPPTLSTMKRGKSIWRKTWEAMVEGFPLPPLLYLRVWQT